MQFPRDAANAEQYLMHQLYRDIGKRSTAEEVVNAFEGKPELQKAHLVLYVQAKLTLRRAEVRRERLELAIFILASVVKVGFILPLVVLAGVVADVVKTCFGLFSSPAPTAVEAPVRKKRAPRVRKAAEPAVARVEQLVKEGELAEAKREFDDQAGAVVSPVGEGPGSEAFAPILPAKAA